MSTLKIYGIPQSRAFRAMWMAGELGVPYEHVPLSFRGGDLNKSEYLEINPNARIPAIDDDGFRLWESMAINLYLAKKHGGELAPKDLQEDALMTQWSFWAMTEIEKPLLQVLFHRVLLPEDQRDPKVAEQSEKDLQRPLGVLDKILARTKNLVGDRFTAADLNVAAVLNWARASRLDLSKFPNVQEWLKRCTGRDACNKVMDMMRQAAA